MNTQPKPFNTTVLGQDLIVNSNLQGFQIYKRTSSFIAYIATEVIGDTGNKLFIQFNTGVCVVFPDVPKDIVAKAVGAPSIGKFYHAELKDKFEVLKVEDNCIQPAPEDDEDTPDVLGMGIVDDDDDLFDF